MDGKNLLSRKNVDLKENYKISGMVCAACAQTIEKVVGDLPGVSDVSVNLATERMSLTVHDKSTTPDKIIAAVKSSGYDAAPAEDMTQKTHEKEQEAKKRQLNSVRNRMITAIVLSSVLLTIVLVPQFMQENYVVYMWKIALEFVLAVCVLFFGRDLLIGGAKALFHGAPNMDSLVFVGSGIAFLYSIYATIVMLITRREQTTYYDASAMILALVMLGSYLEALSEQKTNSAMTSLLSLIPKTALVLRGDKVTEVPVDTIEVGDSVVVRSGQTIPVDGVITQGETTVDNSLITGESVPVKMTVGNTVVGGSINQNGQITYRATKVGKDTVLSHIIDLVAQAQGSKAPIARIADRVSRWFVPSILVIALIGFCAWIFTGHSFTLSLNILVATVVVACPCALGLATPMAIMVATGKGARHGILFKSGGAVELFTKVKTIVFDKTGTITKGKPTVTAIYTSLPEGDTHIAEEEKHILLVAASLEFYTEHPLAKAILSANSEQRQRVTNFNTLPGLGIEGMIGESHILVGNEHLLTHENLSVNEALLSAQKKALDAGQTLVYVAEEKKVIGLLSIADPLKPTAPHVIRTLTKYGIHTVLLTGDNAQTAARVAAAAGIQTVYSDVLPEGKADVIKKIQKESPHPVAMVGDGINDAPALAQADIGIAIGTGTDVAINCAQIVLMSPQLSSLLTAYELSHATMRNIKENLFWAFFYNACGIPIALGILTLFGGPLLNPMIAAGAMGISSITVVLNALRLNYFHPRGETEAKKPSMLHNE